MTQHDDPELARIESSNKALPISQPSPDDNELADTIQSSIDNFIINVEGVREIAPFFEVITDALAFKHRKDFEIERDRFGTIISERDGNQEIRFPLEKSSEARKALRKLQSTRVAQRALPNMFLLAIVSQYDAFLTDLLKSLLQAKPEIAFTSDKTIRFSEISKFASLDQVKESLIEKEVETIVRQSHAKQFEVLEKLFSVPLREGLDIWPDFIEITERRNLLAHTNGVVSSQYVAVCRSNGVQQGELPNVGEKLRFPPDYLEKCYRVLYEISMKLAHVLWRKVVPRDLRSSDAHYNEKCFQLIKSGQYELAIKMLDFMCDVVRRHSEENLRLFMEINRCNAHRLAGNAGRCRELLSGMDTSALGLEFRLAEAILRDDYAGAAALMRAIGARHDVVTAFAYSEWPLFEGFRDSEHFLNVYEAVFGSPFTISTGDGSAEAIKE